MANPRSALVALKNYLSDIMDPAPEPRLIPDQIALEPPDADRMQFPIMVFLVLERGESASDTFQGTRETYGVTAYIIVKMSEAHTGTEALTQAALEYMAAMTNAIITDPTLGGTVYETSVNGWNFYPAVEGLTKAAGIEITLTLLM
jgi:hypothetical protein